jgi:Ca-activated chloride channel family protein
MSRTLTLAVVLLLSLSTAGLFIISAAQNQKQPDAAGADAVAPGVLEVVDAKGTTKGVVCPLKHTSVRAEISGFIARVTVAQEFENTLKEKIEAVYTFPLSADAAVDRMTLKVGERTVVGRVLRREQAQAVYEAARERGQVASLLDQERPNIFTQSVANIAPGERVTVEISYVEKLKYEGGTYEFSFPMTVGPRYVPGDATGRQGGGFAPDTTRVPDASRITPRPAPPGARAGHDIDLTVALDAGVPVGEIRSSSHEIVTERASEGSATVRLKDAATIPNKDFVLRYDAAGRQISDALLTHRDSRGGYFTLILQPPTRVEPAEATPKEIVFVIDTSGSMSGFPIEKAKEAMKYAIDGLNPQDTFNLITFSGDTRILFPQPVAPTPENLKQAHDFLAASAGYGGTEMMKAIRAALDPSDSQAHVRVVCFMTDGYVGNDMEIVGEIQKHPNARVFSFGIGSSVNRFLLDKMAEYGRGEVEYVSLNDDGSAAAHRFYERVRSPLLTDISLEWEGVEVEDVYPRRVPDLFGAKPVVVTGRYTAGGRGVVHLRGRMRGREFARDIAVDFPESEPRRDVLASLWARARVDDLMGQDMTGMQRGAMRDDLKQSITQLGIEYGLMTQFTSFVAVEEMTVTEGGKPRRIEVPVEMPEGVSREGIFGTDKSGGSSTAYSAQFGANAGYIARPAEREAFKRVAPRASMPVPPPKPQATPAPNANANAVDVDEVMRVDTKVTPEQKKEWERQQKEQELFAKLDPSLRAIVERLKNKETKPTADEAKFVRDGKAEVQVWLVEKTPEALAELKKLGFEVLLEPSTAKLVIGRVALDKLAALAELKQVRYVAAQMTGS